MMLPLAARVVPDKFPNVVRGDREDEGVFARFQQMDEHLEELVVLFNEPRCILAPESLRFVHGAPFEPSCLHLGGVLVERAQILDGRLEFLHQECNVVGNVFVVEFVLLQDRQLLEHFGLNHGHAVLLDHGRILGLFDHVAEDGQDDAGHLILDRVVQYVAQDGNDLVSAS